jgi:hypothetical protein
LALKEAAKTVTGDFIELNVCRKGQKIGCKLTHQEPAYELVLDKFAKPVRQSIS